MKKGVIIQASARSRGNTNKIVRILQNETNFDIIDLNEKNIGHFDYNFKNQNDDFNKLFKQIVANYETILFATPIYWYSMSGLLKVFLDRISDFLFQEKEVGRQLRNMKMGVISCGSENQVFKGFTMPFEQSANYLGMGYLGHLHTWISDDTVIEEVKQSVKEYAKAL